MSLTLYHCTVLSCLFQVIEELSKFDGQANSSYQWTWTFSDDFQQTVYYPASSYAMDTNLTFKVNEWICNIHIQNSRFLISDFQNIQ
jgi:hypothetical protein